MHLYLIMNSKEKNASERRTNSEWDSFDSAVVCAHSEEEARMIHPSGEEWNGINKDRRKDNYSSDDWIDAKDVIVEYIGEAAQEYSSIQVICASFNAG